MIPVLRSGLAPDQLFGNIVTKLLLATIVAVSGAVLCISYRLEFLSSSRLISVDPKSQRNRMLIDVIFCYIIPIIYMAIRTFPACNLDTDSLFHGRFYCSRSQV